MNVIDVDPEFADDILLVTLLKTQVENLHAVSHFKHETFTVLQYAQDFGTIMKESIKRTSRWTAKYYTHDRSYYSVPQSAVPLSAVATMAPLPSEGITPSMENRTDERMVKELQYTNGRLGVRQQKIKLGPCRLLSTLFNPPPTSLKRDYDSLRKSISLDRIPYHNQLSAYNLWTMGKFLRCSRITERYKLMNMRQILMMKTPKMKNI